MTPEVVDDAVKREAARLAFAMVRFASAIAFPWRGDTPPGLPKIGTEAYVFGPSWKMTPRDEVEAFLVGLPSPALLVPTLTQGVIVLTLVEELSGDRRRWAEKTLSNFVANLDEMGPRLGLSSSSRVLVEFDDESHVFSFATVRYWAGHMAVDIGFDIGLLEGEPRADACLRLMRSDGKWFPGRSSMVPPSRQ